MANKDTNSELVAGRVDPDLAKRLEAIAKREDRSISAEVRRAVRAYVEADRAAA
jgi:predicted transcriptional regulator